ncbi:MAG: RsmD family RNA methyltransferase [Deltaproteobacteria bacterium]|nr:RsmD family RNA methyltransferase [Deltaproteobacteria bacterium]
MKATRDERALGLRRVVCEHAIACGGCELIGLTYGEQLSRKLTIVTEALARFTELDAVAIEPVVPTHTLEGYRTRAKLVTGPNGSLGLYAHGTHEPLDLPRCRVLSPAIAEAAATLRARMQHNARNDGATREPAMTAVADGGALLAVDLRAVQPPSTEDANTQSAAILHAQLLITLIVSDERIDEFAAREACERLLHDKIATSAAVSFHDTHTAQLLGHSTQVLAGPSHLRDLVAMGPTWQLAAPGAFVQAHREGAANAYALVSEGLGDVSRARVLELYAGAGAIGLTLAAQGAEVTLVESFPPAIAAAREAAIGQGLTRVRAVVADTKRFVEQALAEQKRYDIVVINPPRRGVDREAIVAIAALAPIRVAYISCDPETLARDLATFASHGYLVCGEVMPVDMIPLTEQVECVVILERVRTTPARVLQRTERWAVLEGPSGVRALARDMVRTWDGWQGAVPIAGAEGDESGLLLVAQSQAAGDSLGEITIEATAYVRGVSRDKGLVRTPEGTVRYRRRAIEGGHSEVALTLIGVTTREARRQLTRLEHPVLGDQPHGHKPTNAFAREKLGLDRTALHVRTIAAAGSAKAQANRWQSEMSPGELALLVSRLRARSKPVRSDTE